MWALALFLCWKWSSQSRIQKAPLLLTLTKKKNRTKSKRQLKEARLEGRGRSITFPSLIRSVLQNVVPPAVCSASPVLVLSKVSCRRVILDPFAQSVKRGHGVYTQLVWRWFLARDLPVCRFRNSFQGRQQSISPRYEVAWQRREPDNCSRQTGTSPGFGQRLLPYKRRLGKQRNSPSFQFSRTWYRPPKAPHRPFLADWNVLAFHPRWCGLL